MQRDQSSGELNRFARTTALVELMVQELERLGRKGAEALFTNADGASLIEIGDRGCDLEAGSWWFTVYSPITGELRRVTVEDADPDSEKLAQVSWDLRRPVERRS